MVQCSGDVSMLTRFQSNVSALSSRSFAECQAIHAKLMQTEFGSEGKWLLGFKRLMDVYALVPS